jgi:ADP-ribose pyrophosphatase YjhB (NUDIX family)
MSSTYEEYLSEQPNILDNTDKVRLINGIPYKEACHGLIYRPTPLGLEVLLIRKKIEPGKAVKLLGRIGGRVKEKDETLDDCMYREAYEETGIVAKIIYREDDNLNKASQNKNIYYLKNKKEHVIAHKYILIYISGIEENKEPYKHEEVGWFLINNLPRNIYPDVRADIINGIPRVREYLKYMTS